MSKRERWLKVIEQRWFARFGEPPSLRTDPALMQRILESDDSAPRSDDAEPPVKSYRTQ